jgi:hypothetical protein
MRRRTKDTLNLLTFLAAFGLTLTAMTAPRWVSPRWLGMCLAAIGWTAFALFNLGQVVVCWTLFRRPVASRPWILGGPPNPSPTQDSTKRSS